MNVRLNRIALAGAISIFCLPGLSVAAPCINPLDLALTPCDDGEYCTSADVCDGANLCVGGPLICDEQTGAGKTGGHFRMTFPDDWDGDLVIANHGFDLNDKHIRPHNTCSNNTNLACDVDADCGGGNFCNKISYMGLDQILLPMGKAIAAPTYSTSGWAPFQSAKDIKDILKYVKKESGHGDELQRVIITGFSGGGAVTVDAMVKLKIDGAVPLCAASGGALPTWDLAMDVRLIYDFLCDGVAPFASAPDQGEVNSSVDSGGDAVTMALKVDTCFGVIGFAPHEPGMDTRLAQFNALTNFSGGDSNVPSAMGFATLGLGDFVRDPNRLDGKRIGLNTEPVLNYSTMGSDAPLAMDFDTAVERLAEGKGRKKLAKAYNPTFTKGKGSKIEYPILAMAGAADWLVLPEFQKVFSSALTLGGKAHTQTWIDTFGHCTFSEEETTAVFNKFFDWLGPLAGPTGIQPTAADVEAECIAIGGIDGDTCNFNAAFVPGNLYDRIPTRADWPAGALP